MDSIRRRRIDLLTGGKGLDPANPAVAAAVENLDVHTASLLASGAPDFPADMGVAWAMLVEVRDAATAWATPASRYYRHGGVSFLVADFLLRWDASCGPDSPELGNWWHWEIGVPHVLTDIGLLMGDELGPAPIAAIDAFVSHFVADPNVRTKSPALLESGANRADKAAITVKHGALVESALRVQAGRDAAVDSGGGGALSLFALVEKGDGLYRDGSYIQHEKLAYAGAYGLVTLAELADLMFLLAASPWAVNDDDAQPFLDSVERCYSPFITDGYMMDCTRGRGVSRSFATDEHMGAVAAGAVARLATVVGSDSSYAGRWASLVKGWMERHPGMPTDHLPLNRLGLLHAIAVDAAIVPASAMQGHVQTPDQERVVHRTASWQASFSLSSRRRGRFEWGNDENLHGWHQGDGHVQLFTNADRGTYSGHYWATSDPLHLPGVTNVVRVGGFRDVPGTGIPPASAAWAGGVAWGAEDAEVVGLPAGTLGMDARHLEDGLSGVKSWFCLPDFYVALGAGIEGTRGHAVHTTIEARRLQDPLADFKLHPAHGEAPAWAQLENVAGYLVFDAGNLQEYREERTGSWRDINVGGSSDTLSGQYQLLYVDHGVDPAGAGYAYSVHPGAELDRMPYLAADPPYKVLSNTAGLQALDVPGRGLLMANFFQAGHCPPSAGADGISADGTAAVVFGEVAGESGEKLLRLSLSDPAQRNEPLTLTVRRDAAGMIASPASTVFDSGPGWFSVTVPMVGKRGHGGDVVLRLP